MLAALLGGLIPAIAPVLPHMAEDAWQALPYPAPAESVFLVRLRALQSVIWCSKTTAVRYLTR